MITSSSFHGYYPTRSRHVPSLTGHQMCLLVSIITVTWCVPRGLGKHVYAAPVENLSSLALIGNVTGSLSILAAVWSKTSFALTLLRLLQGKLRALVWFIIVSSNVAMGLNALFVWIRCIPVSKTWNVYEEGSCWEPHVYPNFGMFAAGKIILVRCVMHSTSSVANH